MNKKFILTTYIFLIFFPFYSCNSQNTLENSSLKAAKKYNNDSLEIIEFYNKYKFIDKPSKTIGAVNEGKLQNGKIMPFYGKNYTYFDKGSYLAFRAFTSDELKTVIINSYDKLYQIDSTRKFYLMELSHQNGGKLFPHRTHQNGLSVDFMMPKLKNGNANYELDTLGKNHYFLEFNNLGEYSKDNSIKIDFDLIAKHILILNEEAKKINCSIEKVIIKTEYKNQLFSSPHGVLLKNSGIYIVKSLTPLINDIHDDHYHIDFKINN